MERRTPERNSYPEAPVQTLDKNLNRKTERTSTTPTNPPGTSNIRISVLITRSEIS